MEYIYSATFWGALLRKSLIFPEPYMCIYILVYIYSTGCQWESLCQTALVRCVDSKFVQHHPKTAHPAQFDCAHSRALYYIICGMSAGTPFSQQRKTASARTRSHNTFREERARCNYFTNQVRDARISINSSSSSARLLRVHRCTPASSVSARGRPAQRAARTSLLRIRFFRVYLFCPAALCLAAAP